MSGGHWDYEQYHIDAIANGLEEYIYGRELDEEDVDYYINDLFFWNEEDGRKAEKYVREHKRTLPNRYEYSEDTLAEFRKGLDILRRAYVYAQRIDWLLSGDDGEESFHKRLKEELDELINIEKNEHSDTHHAIQDKETQGKPPL